MKISKTENGSHGGGYFGSSYHVINILFNLEHRNCLLLHTTWTLFLYEVKQFYESHLPGIRFINTRFACRYPSIFSRKCRGYLRDSICEVLLDHRKQVIL